MIAVLKMRLKTVVLVALLTIVVVAIIRISLTREDIDPIDQYNLLVLPFLKDTNRTPADGGKIYDQDISSSFRPCVLDPLYLLERVYKRRVTLLSKNNKTFSRFSSSCSDDHSIPNVVHYLWLDRMNFNFANHLAILSASKFIRPDYIFIHGNVGIGKLPGDSWWNETIFKIPDIYWVDMEKPENAPNGLGYRSPWHVSDYVRIKVILELGGVYMDNDVLLCRSIEDLRRYHVVYPGEQPGKISPALLLGHRGAPFLRIALELYKTYQGKLEAWDRLGLQDAFRLSRLFPHLIYVIRDSFNLQGPDLLFETTMDWSKNYFIHLWRGRYVIPDGPKDVLDLKSTFGEVARLILQK